MNERARKNLIDLLKSRKKDTVNGVDKLFHSLQTATRALRDGRDDEYVVCALFHDVAGGIAPDSHGIIAAKILSPFICLYNYDMLAMHEKYQTDNWLGLARSFSRDEEEDESVMRTIEFVDKYDFPSFDPNYPTDPLETFLPIVERVIK